MVSCASCCWCHPWRSPPCLVLPCSQRLRHAGKPYTVRRGGRGMSLCTCVMLGGTDRAPYQTGLPAVSPYHRTAVAPKTKIILPWDEAKTAKAGAVRLRNRPKHCWASESSLTLGVYRVSYCTANPFSASLSGKTNIMWQINAKRLIFSELKWELRWLIWWE